ncbi:hypothetical protein JANAI62_18090 [Jannaschia pagri]|uniref:HupE / UreJ protein n=1 Tax=Jannaschia pagri TaxID=2829797 RepID=A0ABQ4NLA4_9RHOB|nr:MULTISPECIES: HupE/UreJ family protein [unclassified Jannaschia]GIT91352.1 hypothetical protein JANAI61_18100 [Jannaschia sp. AI_61]GIT95186.1 hypothetical protein JANAI62_18090 [Jannaschia sp. AI_62]
MAHILKFWVRVIFVALLSMGAAFTTAAHEVEPAVADAQVSADRVDITIRMAVEPILAGIDLAGVSDVNDSPLSGRNDALRALPPAELATALTDAWPQIARRMTLMAGETELMPELTGTTIPDVGNPELRRDSTLILTAALPEDGTEVVFGWDAGLGSLILRQVGEGATYEVFLTGGALSDPMPRIGVADQSLGEVVSRYTVSGFIHVIPDGLDHILFVLGLYFFALALRPLVWQVTAFTVAHTLTLALATTGVIAIPDNWMWAVETVIAASIVYVAVENIWGGEKTDIGWTRIGVVFLFGLVHGLGFASVLSEFGVGSHFVASLVSFAIGLEIGHLTVIAVAFLVLGLPFGQRSFYRRACVIPGSLLIAAVGAYWVLNRIGLVGDLPYLT